MAEDIFDEHKSKLLQSDIVECKKIYTMGIMPK